MKIPSRREILQVIGGTLLLPLGVRGKEGKLKKARIKIGQIGVGHAHATKLEVYRASPDYEVVGIVEPNEALRQQAMNDPAFAGVPWMTQEQLLDVSGLQAVLVETEVRNLLKVAEACVAAGKHIHLDKPAGESLPQFEQVLIAAAKQGRMVQLGYMYRYNPAIIVLREFLKRGWLGEPFEVHAVMSKQFPLESRRKAGDYDGGVMFELGCHLIDLVVGVLGKPDNVASYRRRIADSDDQLVDNMLAVLDYPKAIASIKSSAVEVEGQRRRHFVVCGTEGTFHVQPLDAPAIRVAFSKGRGEYTKGYQDIALPKFQRYIADAADMAAVIRGEKQDDFPYEHELNVQTIVLKASGQPLT